MLLKPFLALSLASSALLFGGGVEPAQMGVEIQSILSSKELKERLGEELPLSIEKVSQGYILHTGNFRVVVDVLYLQEGEKGGKPFKLRFHERLSSSEGQNV